MIPEAIRKLQAVLEVPAFTLETYGASKYHLAVVKHSDDWYSIDRVYPSGIATRIGAAYSFREAVQEMFERAEKLQTT